MFRIHWLHRCILLNFYIKPQRYRTRFPGAAGCILLNFYIKPQRNLYGYGRDIGCILLNFYIKPQLEQVDSSSSGVVSY